MCLGITTDMHQFPVVHLLDGFPDLPHDLGRDLNRRLLLVCIHKVKQISCQEFVDECSLLLIFVDMQTQAMAAGELGIQALTLIVRVVRHVLQNERPTFASGFSPSKTWSRIQRTR